MAQMVIGYQYDGDGHRISKTIGSTTTAGSDLVAIENAPAAGAPCSTCLIMTDDLGSVRILTDLNGNIISRHDYLPFGEEAVADANRPAADGFADADKATQRFTGKERDAEMGLDFSQARYYGAPLGRFSSPDGGSDQQPSDPQSWNLYAYVRNNPLINTDPSGLDCITTSSQSTAGIIVTTDVGGSADTCNGIYVNGTVDVGSYSYNGSSLTWSDNTVGGGGAINFVSSSIGDWDSGSSNMLGARQIGMTAPIGEALGYATGGVVLGASAGIAYGAWAGGLALTSLAIPAATLPPAVSNPTLQSIVQKLFQETDVLPGGTAGAVRYELVTGELMSPSGHSMKAQEVITALTNLLKSGKPSFNDQIVSRQLIQDLSDALRTQPRR